MIALGQLLTEGREAAQLTLEQAAQELKKRYGVKTSDSTLSRLENGEPTRIDPKLVTSLIDLYGLDPRLAYVSLGGFLGTTGVVRFLKLAVTGGFLRPAIDMLEALEHAA